LSKNNYVDPIELETLILRDIEIGELSKESKKILSDMISGILLKRCYINYDDDTKGDMYVKALTFITRYWAGYRKFRWVYVLYNVKNDNSYESTIKQLKSLKEFRRIRPKTPEQISEASKYHQDNNDFLIVSIIPDKAKLFNSELKEYKIEYNRFKEQNSIFAYFTQYIESAFKQVLNDSKFLYKKGISSLYDNMTVYSLDKEDEYDMLIHDSESTMLTNHLSKEDGLDINIHNNLDIIREDDVIYDREVLIDSILANSHDLDEIIDTSYEYLKDKTKSNLKTIYNDPTLLYFLLKQ
jgi:hypothetical protein